MKTNSIVTANTEYKAIDITKVILALLIPLLHFSYEGGSVYTFFEQYVARLCVPFFYAISGFFFERSLSYERGWNAYIHFFRRCGCLLLFWLVFDLPVFIASSYSYDMGWRTLALIAREVLFRTPGYLWYLTSVIVGGSILFGSHLLCTESGVGCPSVLAVVFLGCAWQFVYADCLTLSKLVL